MNGQGVSGPGTSVAASRGLLAAVIGMGVLLAVGSLVLVGVLVHRISHPKPAAIAGLNAEPAVLAGAAGNDGELVLGEPVGTHVSGMTREREGVLAVALTGGGGPDRVLLWDVQNRRIVGRLVMSPVAVQVVPAP
ncbi:hypothetical protein GLI01_34580 [Gluconacetobacter liquefaciens]|uniref:Uncharacterized protein n=1 Tax=Gluconacetobacter liquefaciens TaxID=89584 RepID=A0A370G0L6_GLULI|nr:hypothetical protein [Gluconacetobacter liquefaciens]MBB2187815.1 hypothetical protein [Gluconacetobacter liquefaciens]RDI37282.1 hypothetical protein C7453_1064 [Gluconacetobacter liquefaciens]GBR00536.1 hypothetical protein AA0522_1406 [Gluconacetobacter liquefaciens NRIC 0522]GEB39423.1 hypothetical protein GLI01_34580 [Gluconacetobacter liquefaciens]